MVKLVNHIAKNIIKKPVHAFLLDGIGALLSAILLIFLIAPFENFFGLHKSIAFNLSIPVFGFTIFSFSCYFLNIKNWKPFLLLIAIANFIYCCTTLVITITHYLSLKAFGILYFSGEILAILAIVSIELITLKQNHSS